jgi:hypothetical protein
MLKVVSGSRPKGYIKKSVSREPIFYLWVYGSGTFIEDATRKYGSKVDSA